MRLFLLSTCLFISLFALGNENPIKRMGNAQVVSFDADWQFKRYGLQPEGTQLAEPEGLEKVEVDDANWQKLDLPHDYAITGPFRIELSGSTGKLPYQGIGWYRKHFQAPELKDNERVYIDFDGAMANAKVWLNGKYVGTWPFGYNSFRLDLTPFLKKGEDNVLAVRLDTEKLQSRWYSGAGIYRHVWLVKTAPVHVGHWGTYITTPEISDAKAKVNTEINVENFTSHAVEAKVQTRYYELNLDDTAGKEVASTQSTIKIGANRSEKTVHNAEIQNPKRWDITSPNRYLARTEVSVGGKVVDTYNTPFGIRTIEFTANRGFLLNGRRVQINGVCMHHDLGSLGAAFNKSALERQLLSLQEMGCNSVRTSHNPPAPELLELADKMGILIWDEAFDAWQRGKRKYDYSRIYQEWHEKDILALVHRDRNHPSVFIWSIGNEVMEQQSNEMTRHLADIMRKADPTRPISNGYNDPDGGRESGAVTALDLMGVNYFFGQTARWEADERYKNMPTVGSETSSCVSSRGEYFFGTDYQDWQITSYDRASPGWGCSPDVQFRTQAQFPNLLGEYVWTGWDYLGEPTPYNSDETNLLNFRTDPSKKAELEQKLKEIADKNPPSRSSYFGIIDLAGFKKDRFYSYQAQWRPELPMAHILPHWNWEDRKGEVTPVHVYTSGTEAELFVNGKSQGRKVKKADEDFRLEWNEVVYQPGTVKVVAYKDGKVWATYEVKTRGKATTLALSSDKKVIDAGDNEYAFVTVTVQDNGKQLVPRSNPLIKFSVEGAGEIVSTDNGNQIDFTPFQSHERNAFNGLALVIVKTKKGEAGKIMVKAESKGLKPAKIELASK